MLNIGRINPLFVLPGDDEEEVELTKEELYEEEYWKEREQYFGKVRDCE